MKEKIGFWKALVVAAWLSAVTVLAQSPNLTSTVTKLQVSGLQSTTQKGQANGYAPLDGSVLVPPQYLFPDFAGADAFTVWAKSGSALVPMTSLKPDTTGLTVNSIRIGQLSVGQWGLAASDANTPLFLKSGSTSGKIYVGSGQWIGGSNSSGDGYDFWSISPTGGFKFGAGEFTGALDLNNQGLTEVATVAGGATTIFLSSTPGIKLTGGNFTFTLDDVTKGVIIPSTGSAANPSFALNTTSATALFVRKDQANTIAGTQTFSAAPVVPDSSFAIAKTSGLQTALDARVKLDGTSAGMTGALNLGSNRIINVANPMSAQDAVTLNYLQTNYSTAAVTTVSTAAGTPIVASKVGNTVTLSLSAANSSGTNGYLSSANFAIFNAKENALTFSPSSVLSRTGNTISIPQATGSVAGYLSAADWTAFNSKQAAITATAPLSLAGGTLTLSTVPVASGGTGTTSASSARVTLGLENETALVDQPTIILTPSEGQYHTVTLTANRILDFSGHFAGRRFYVKIKQDATGSRTVTWDTEVRWPGGAAPTLTTTANRSDLFLFIDTGNYYLGTTVALNYSES